MISSLHEDYIRTTRCMWSKHTGLLGSSACSMQTAAVRIEELYQIVQTFSSYDEFFFLR